MLEEKEMTEKVQIIKHMKLKELTRAVSRLIDSPLARRGSIEVSAGSLEAGAPVAVHLEVGFLVNSAMMETYIE